MNSNHISLVGNHNIVIEDAQSSHIYVNSDEDLKKLLAEHGDKVKELILLLNTKSDTILS